MSSQVVNRAREYVLNDDANNVRKAAPQHCFSMNQFSSVDVEETQMNLSKWSCSETRGHAVNERVHLFTMCFQVEVETTVGMVNIF